MSKFLKIFERLLFILLVVILVVIPLLPKFPFFNVSGTFVAIRLEDFLVALVLLLWGVYIIVSKQARELLHDKLIQVIVLFFLIGALSTFSSIYLTHSVSPHLGVLHFLRRIEFISLLPVVWTIIRTQKQVEIALVLLFIVLGIVNLYALGQQYLNFPIISTTNSEFSKGQIIYLTAGGRVNSTFAGHYDLAIFLMMMLTLLTALIFSGGKKILNLFYVALLGISAFVLVLTATRFSFLGAIAGGTMALWLTGKKKLIYVLAVIFILVLIYPSQLRDRLFSTISINLLKEGPRYTQTPTENSFSKLDLLAPTPVGQPTVITEATSTATFLGRPSDIAPGEPIDPTQLGVYRSLTIRLNVEWPAALRAFQKNPLLGSGYSSLGLATDNDYLRLLGEVGILGFIAFFLIIFEVVKRVRQNYLTSKNKFIKYFSAGLLSMIFAFLANAFFIDVFEASKVAILFWMIIGINLSLWKKDTDETT